LRIYIGGRVTDPSVKAVMEIKTDKTTTMNKLLPH
jgi:hypothetical protein